jgi:hypothetical protein
LTRTKNLAQSEGAADGYTVPSRLFLGLPGWNPFRLTGVESLPVEVNQGEVEVESEQTGLDPLVVVSEPGVLGKPSLDLGRNGRRLKPERIVSARL